MAQSNNFNQASNSNNENNQPMNQNNQNTNQNRYMGTNQGQSNHRHNQNRNQNLYQNQNPNQNHNQRAEQPMRNQRHSLGFNRFGNSYSNYYNNSNSESNQGNSKETQSVQDETQRNTNSMNSSTSNNSINNSHNNTNNNLNSIPTNLNNQSNMNQKMNNRNINMDDTANNKESININQNIDTTVYVNQNSDTPKLQNESIYQSNAKSSYPSSNNNSNDNNQSNDDNSYNTRHRMNNHNPELNIASTRNSFDVNDGGTPVIKLGGQYGFNLDKKIIDENNNGNRGHETAHTLEEDVLKISSVAHSERKHTNKKLYCSDKPYPKVEVSGENMDYAIHLLNDYAGSLSELTAITSYCFLNLVLVDDYQEIKDTYRGISIVEMRHLHMLGELIKKLGVLPRYYAKDMNQTIMWNSSFVSGDTDMRATLLNSIKNEEAGIAQYQKQIGLIDDDCIKVVLERIILDEEVHVTLLYELLNKYCPE